MKRLDYNLHAASAALIGDNPEMARHFTMDKMYTYDQATIDSTGAFLNGELERLDQTLHLPLVAYTWMRDIDLREDVSVADEVSSFTNSSFSAPAGISTKGGARGGKSWAAKNTNAITGIGLDIGKTAQPLTIWAEELSWSLPELASAQKLGRPVDQQKYQGMQLKWNMDADAMVYTGDYDINQTGLFNSAAVTAYSVPVGVSGSKLWTQKTPTEILADVNGVINNAWAASGWAVIPDQLRLPPTEFSYINSQLISAAGTDSIMKFIMDNNLVKTSTGRKLTIQPVKWLIGGATGGTIGTTDGHDRMVAYNKDVNYVRFPMTL